MNGGEAPLKEPAEALWGGALWRARASRYWSLIARYMAYVVQSGFGLFVIALFIAGSISYSRWLQEVPPGYPAERVAMLLLGPIIWWSPIRSFITAADLQFTLPAEGRMASYFRTAALYAWGWQAIVTMAALIGVWPLFVRAHGMPGHPMWLYVAVLLIAKGINVAADWREGNMREPLHRRAFALVRLLVCLGVAYVMFAFGLERSGLFSLLVWVTLLAAERLAPVYKLHWERLKETEDRDRRRMARWLSWFVETDEPPVRVRPRKAAAAISERLPWKPEAAYTYLYEKMLLRTDVLGIVIRLIAACWLFELLYRGWVAAAACAAGTALCGVQLTTLSVYGRRHLWVTLSPVPPALRIRSVIRVTAAVQAIAAILLALPLIWAAGRWEWFMLAASVSLLIVVINAVFVLPRKWQPASTTTSRRTSHGGS